MRGGCRKRRGGGALGLPGKRAKGGASARPKIRSSHTGPTGTTGRLPDLPRRRPTRPAARRCAARTDGGGKSKHGREPSVSHSLYFLAAACLAAQAADARPLPQVGGVPAQGGDAVIVEQGPVYVNPPGQVQTGGWQPQQPRRPVLSRIGGWFGGLFGRGNRQSQPMYQGGGPIQGPYNGQVIPQPVIQPQLNTNEPPLPGAGKVSVVVPQDGQVPVTEQGGVAQVAHGPGSTPRMDLPVAEKFKNRIGHEADYS